MALWHPLRHMTKPVPGAAAEPNESSLLAESINQLTSEMALLRQVLDEVREDFSWLTRNGLPVQPIEHIVIQGMASDPCADDWCDKLQITRTTSTAPAAASPLDSKAIDQIADDLKRTFEAVAQGQLDLVLSALDGVRLEIVRLLRHRQTDEIVSPLPTQVATLESTPPVNDVVRQNAPPPGRLF